MMALRTKLEPWPRPAACFCSCLIGATILLFAFVSIGDKAVRAQPGSHNAGRRASINSKPASLPRQESVPDLAGFWEMRDESGSGSFGGVSEKVPTAQVMPEVKKFNEEAKARQKAGYVVSFASRYCQYLGMPFIMGQSPPIDIVESKDEILIMSEQSSAPRHIYTDGRGHPDSSTYEPTTNGHSIGHWEGESLVVDTVGFNELGARGVPGGGLRTTTSHLVEHFHLFDGGKRLSITFTWDDPKVYLGPHTYELRYYKDPPGTYAYEDFCDAGDPAQGQSVIPPPQQ
jgi:hypothetical protein